MVADISPAAQAQAYKTFFETHVTSGVADGMLQLIDVKDFPKALANLQATDNARQALNEHRHVIADFAKRVGAEKLAFTNEGTWIVPPKMRGTAPEYKEYLLKNYNGDAVPGTAAITLVQNQPIPIYDAKTKEQLGGFESGDGHGFLTIIDRRNNTVSELHQTFLENSFDPAFRPGIVSLNLEQGTKEKLNVLVKDPKTELDGVGMLGANRQIGLASYQCELIPDPDAAFNWNGGIKGANFNYVPITAIEFKLTEQQLDVLKFDRALAAKECAVVADPTSPTQNQNAKGFVPLTRDAVYPDGTARYVIATKTMQDGEEVTVFTNASPDATGKVPAGAIRVKEYVTRVDASKMQAVKPYNHHGGSKGGFADADNCFSSIGGLLDNVAAHGRVDQSLLQTVGIQSLSEAGIKRMAIGLVMNKAVSGLKNLASNLISGNVSASNSQRVSVDGPVSGNVDIYTGKGNMTVYDFCDIQETLIKSFRKLSEPKLQGLSGTAIQVITEQRQKGTKAGERVAESDLVLFPTTTIGTMISNNLHMHVYGPKAAAQQTGTAARPTVAAG